jgi:hypothetical protein
MKGVPANLPIERFVGDALFQVCLGMDGVHFAFGRAGTISVFGHWELQDRMGNLVDRAREPEDRKAYYLHVIFNEDVVAAAVDPPRSFSLTFSNGHRLTIYDDTPQFESFAIQPDGIVV